MFASGIIGVWVNREWIEIIASTGFGEMHLEQVDLDWYLDIVVLGVAPIRSSKRVDGESGILQPPTIF